METIPEEHKATIRALIEADPEVAQATCDIPHLNPRAWLNEGEGDVLPYCGCFVGVYAWMQQCKRGNTDWILGIEAPNTVAWRTNIPQHKISGFGVWCNTIAKDRAAVVYARGLLNGD